MAVFGIFASSPYFHENISKADHRRRIPSNIATGKTNYLVHRYIHPKGSFSFRNIPKYIKVLPVTVPAVFDLLF